MINIFRHCLDIGFCRIFGNSITAVQVAVKQIAFSLIIMLHRKENDCHIIGINMVHGVGKQLIERRCVFFHRLFGNAAVHRLALAV